MYSVLSYQKLQCWNWKTCTMPWHGHYVLYQQRRLLRVHWELKEKKMWKGFLERYFSPSIHPPYMSENAGCTSSGLAKLHKGLPVDLLASVPRWIKEVAIFKKLRRVKSSVVPFEWQSGKDWGVKSKMEKISWMFWQNCGTDAVCRV